MRSLVTYATLEEAHAAGAQLIDAGIPVQVARDWLADAMTLIIEDEDFDRAAQVLELPPQELQEVYKPCPKCGMGDPRFIGKWKGILTLLFAAAILSMGAAHIEGVAYIVILAVIVMAVAITKVRNWECRQCYTRWW